jgi:hypothetical protein
MRKPNFLIVGAAKSGTTSLFQYLRTHPDVFMPELKEASYFAGFNVTTEAKYLELFESAGTKRAVGEASGAYLYAPGAASGIRQCLGPDVRIVIILRHPIDMAYSLWGHMVRDAAEDLPFFDALAAEEKRMADPEFHRTTKAWVYNSAYVARARYARQVAAYLHTFDPQRVRVFIFEEFFADMAASYAELCRFLDISTEHQPTFHAFNRARVVRSQLLRKLLDEPTPWKEVVKALTPDAPRLKIKDWLNNANYKEQRLPALSPHERERLWQLFASDVRELETLLGRRLDCWGARPGSVSLPRIVEPAQYVPALSHDR